MLRRALAVAVCGGLVTVGIGGSTSVSAQAPAPEITLRASKNLVVFGDKVRLKGRIKPALGGQRVNILSGDRIVASDTTNGEGRYSVRVKLARNKTLRAQWTTAVSKRETVRVRPRVHVFMGRPRIFEKTRVNGRVAPAVRGSKITVRLAERGRVVAKKRVKLRKGRFFSTKFRIRSIGPLRARAKFDPKGLAGGKDRTSAKTPPTPNLSEGSTGRFVKVVERRLSKLGYRLRGVNRTFDFTTRDAVIAFHKVQGLPRVGSVADYTWRALARPKKPKPVSKRGYHFEIDQTKQVLYIVRKGKIRTIVHTSTGANGYTHDGVWTVDREIQGYSGGRLYYPSYFHGARAVHGWPEVPTYPASHGCARTPMWIAQWLNSKAFIGMKVRIYHS